VVVGGSELGCGGRGLDQLGLLVDAVDPPEGDRLVVVLDVPPAPGDGVVVVPLGRVRQATLTVVICRITEQLGVLLATSDSSLL